MARDFPRFPVILETYRECLRDVLDLPSLAELLRKLHSRQLSLVEVETPTASPFASSLLFDYVATYMYEGDTPNAERRAAALALDRDLLRELLGQEELRELIDPEALEEVEAQLQHRTEAGRAGDRDALQQVLRNLGDLTAEECAERVAEGYSAASMLEKLVAERRVAERADRRRGALHRRRGRRPLPRRARGAAAGRPARDLPRGAPRRDARPWSAATPAPTAPSRPPSSPSRYGVDPSPALRELEREGALVRGELLPGGTEREWCDADVLRRVRRASLAHLRREVEAADRSQLARFLPSWQNVDAHRAAGAGPDRLREALVPLQGVALTPKVWEARRAAAPARRLLAQPGSTSSAPAARWSGSAPAPLGRSDGRVALYFREDVRLAGPPPANAKLEPPEGEPHDAIRERLAAGPDFWLDLVADLGDVAAEELHTALWDLAWAGEVTNDAFAPLRAPRLRAVAQPERRGRRFARRRSAAGAAVQGRWSLTAPLFADAPAAGPRLRAQAELMLERYGIVTRETVLAEGVPGGFATLYRRARQPRAARHRPPRLLRRGPRRRPVRPARRGRAAALAARRPKASYLVLAATDPANPYGASLPWPKLAGGRRPGRAPGAHLLLRDGEPMVYVERGGRGILRLARARRRGAGRRRCEPWPTRSPPATPQAGDREARRRAGDRLRPRGGPARRRLQPRPPQARPPRPASRRCSPLIDRGPSSRTCERYDNPSGSDPEQSPVELLRSVPLFSDLEEGELERFSRVAVPRAFPAGTRVFHEGDHSDACYIVSEGSFRVTREHSDGRAITLATLGRGEVFGELAMLDGDLRSASAEALTDGELLALPAIDVKALLARHPGDLGEAGRGPGAPPARRQRAHLPPVLPDRPRPRRRRPRPARHRSPAQRRGRRGDDPDEPGRPGPARRHLPRERQPFPRRPGASRRGQPRPGPRNCPRPPKLRNYIY